MGRRRSLAGVTTRGRGAGGRLARGRGPGRLVGHPSSPTVPESAALRELGIITEERNARALADYLLTREIVSKVVANRDGRFSLWVRDEDRLDEARQVHEEFVRNPDDERFQGAARTAKQIRKQAEAAEKEHRRKSLDLRDRWEGPIYRRAPLTSALFAISVAVFVAEKIDHLIYFRLMFSTFAVTEDGELRDLGFRAIRSGEVWRLVTPIFIHFGPAHILFNMLALLAFGQRIEMVRGRGRFLALVLLSAVASNVGQYLAKGGMFGGMSGVIFALGGYLWIKGQVAPGQGLGLDSRNAQYMFIWFLVGVLAPLANPEGTGFPYNMANFAHGIGLLAGLVLGLLRL